MKENIEQYYSVGDIIVLPSSFGEGFSNVLAEGMLCKLIPVATKVGDSQNIIADSGFIVEDFNSIEIAKSLSAALALSEKEMIRRKEKSRNRIIREFGIRKMSNSYNNIYKELT